MVTLRERHDPLRLTGRRLLLAGVAVLVVSAAWQAWGIYGKERESAQLEAQAQAQLSDLELRQAKLQTAYAALQTERGMEAALRDQYGMGATGEGMVVIVEPATATPVQATSSVMQWLKDILSHL